MKTIVINTEIELKSFVTKNRKNITSINGVKFSGLYPILEISRKHATYYNVENQCNEILHSPFNITTL